MLNTAALLRIPEISLSENFYRHCSENRFENDARRLAPDIIVHFVLAAMERYICDLT